MKKSVLAALISAMAVLTACSKPVTEVKKGESQTSAVAHQAQSTHLSTNNKTDIETDISAIQAFGMAQEQKAAPLEQRMDEAMQKQDQVALKSLFNEFRSFVEQSNNELSALKLKSTEANQLRGKMIESSLLGIEMSEILVSGSMEQVDQGKLQPLQEKVMKTQQELMAISQDIHTKIQDQPAGLTPAQSAPELKQ